MHASKLRPFIRYTEKFFNSQVTSMVGVCSGDASGTPVRRASAQGCCLARDLHSAHIFPSRGRWGDDTSRSSVRNLLTRSSRSWVRHAWPASGRRLSVAYVAELRQVFKVLNHHLAATG
jgi:hypothetical protein